MSALMHVPRRRLPLQGALGQSQTLSSRTYSRCATYRRLPLEEIRRISSSVPFGAIIIPAQLSRLQASLQFSRLPSNLATGRHFHSSTIVGGFNNPANPNEKSEPSSRNSAPSNETRQPRQPESEGQRTRQQQSRLDEEEGQDSGEKKTNKNKDRGEDDGKDDGKNKGKDEGKGEGKDEGKEGEGKEGDAPPPPPHGDKTPWQVFTETMSSEFEKSKEWNENTKAIASSAHQFTESDSVRRARQAYDATSGAASSAIKTTAGAIGRGAVWTWDTPVVKGVRKVANVTGDAVEKATRPIRATEAYKNVRDVIDDGSSSRYGGWVEKEERRRKREMQKTEGVQMVDSATEAPQEDLNAGTNVTIHKDSAWKEAWRDFRDSNKFVQSLFTVNKAYKESDNPLVSTARSITDRIGGFFAENEFAQVIKQLRTMEPGFQLEPFIRDLREYILPEVLDAYVKGDTETLKLWLSAAQYSVYEALTKQYLQAGLRSDGRVLDIRNVDVIRARMLEPGDVPVFIITARTQEVHVYRNAKTGELAAGMEDKVQQVTYAIGITRMAEDVNNPETRGWRLIEMQKSGRDWY